MEEHRLIKMSPYDPKLFQELYESTEQLRKKLAWQIDCRRYGVDYKEVLSWFDVKFLFAFNKYNSQNKGPDEIKAHLIQALQFFKNRILRKGYTKSNMYNSMVDIETIYNMKETHIDLEFDEQQDFLKIALDFLKSHLSEDSYQILQIELNPPLYIIRKISHQEKYTTTKIPSDMISKYMGWGSSNRSINKVDECRKEIKRAIGLARSYYYESNFKMV